jgi:hypothetical protein
MAKYTTVILLLIIFILSTTIGIITILKPEEQVCLPQIKLVYINSTSNCQNNPSNATSNNLSFDIQPEYITHLLNSIGAYKLHNMPMSDEPPKIKFIVDSDTFTSQVIDRNITTLKEDIPGEDIVFLTNKKNVVDMMIAKNITSFVKDAFESGDIQFEAKAGEEELFLKGYLEFYSEIKEGSSTTSSGQKKQGVLLLRIISDLSGAQ